MGNEKSKGKTEAELREEMWKEFEEKARAAQEKRDEEDR